ncbi:MAG: transglutaminase protein [Glaciihabitans sp.]|nr:transglutaminase protein [Glaciihabitans sp.]
MKQRPGLGFVIVNMLCLWVAMGIATTALWPIYRSPQIALVVGVVTVVGSLIAILAAVFRWSSPIVLLVSVVAFLLLGVPLAVPAEATFGVLPSLSGLQDLLSGVALGWKQLLTIALPVGDYQALLVPFFTLSLLLVIASLSLALRARFGDLAVLGPVLLFLAAIIFGPSTADFPIPLALGLLAITLLWLTWRRWYRRRQSVRAHTRGASGVPGEIVRDLRFAGARSLVAAVVILVVAGGTALAATAALPPAGSRDVLRTAIEQPFDPRAYPSPLSAFRRYWEQPQLDAVMMRITGLPDNSRIRIATLDTYDGIVYSVGSSLVTSESGSFTRVPYQYDQKGVRGTHVTLGVQVESYSGVWLPTVGQLQSVSFAGSNAASLRDDFYYNNTSGTGAVIGGVSPGDRYTLSAIVPPVPTAAQLATLDAGSASVPSLGTVPAQLSVVLNDYVAGVEGQGKRLVAMIDGLKRNGYISHGVGANEPQSRSGHASDRISQLLTDQRMIGDGEQYAVTAALMARELGYPARVVVGFEPRSNPAGTVDVHGSDIAAWVEVDTAQEGWVAIDATPPVREIPAEQPKDPALIARPQSIVPPPVTDPEPFDRQATPDTARDNPTALDPLVVFLLGVARVVAWLALAAAIFLAPFVFIVSAKIRRRRLRRKAPTALEQISGGWSEFEDAALDHGFLPPLAATRSEVAATVGGGQPAILAAIADRAIFAPTEPDTEEAELVWRAVDELAASLDDNLTRWQRIKARISLRSLGGYSVSSLFKR